MSSKKRRLVDYFSKKIVQTPPTLHAAIREQSPIPPGVLTSNKVNMQTPSDSMTGTAPRVVRYCKHYPDSE